MKIRKSMPAAHMQALQAASHHKGTPTDAQSLHHTPDLPKRKTSLIHDFHWTSHLSTRSDADHSA